MSKSFVSVGVTILDIVGFPINALPEGDSTVLIQQIHICPAGTAAAPAVIAARQDLDTTLVGAGGCVIKCGADGAFVATGVGSNPGVRDFETTLTIMQAGSMRVLEETS